MSSFKTAFLQKLNIKKILEIKSQNNILKLHYH